MELLSIVEESHGKGRAENCRVKQKEPLDIALLCSKLELHRQRQEASKRQLEKRNVVRKPFFAPRYAARQFAATATPLKDDMNWAPMKWTGKSQPNPLSAPEERIHLNPKQSYAAFSTGMTENEVIAVAAAMCQPDSGHLLRNDVRSSPGHGDAAKQVSGESRRGSGSAAIVDSPTTSKEPADPATTTQYRPGDSAKRRVVQDKHSESIPTPFATLKDNTAPKLHVSRRDPNEMPYDMPMRNNSDSHTGVATRPKLVAHDRPNWAQQSQNGDDMRRTLHLPLRKRSPKLDEVDPERRHSDGNVVFKNELAQSGDSRRPSDSLITDAVKLMKKKERQTRRDTFKALFKRS